MAIEITETFTVAAPIERVWDFLVDPSQVVTCMPGAQLDEIMDAENFIGKVTVKLGDVVERQDLAKPVLGDSTI